jgi:ribonuclease P protein component
VVSGRRIGGAVVRNRARRVLKEAWRALSARISGSLDVVLVARPEIRGARVQDLLSELASALRAGGVVSDEQS